MWWLLLPISHATGPLFGEHLLGLRVLQNVPWKYFKNKDVKGSSPCLGVKVPWGEFVGLETVGSGQDLMVHPARSEASGGRCWPVSFAVPPPAPTTEPMRGWTPMLVG